MEENVVSAANTTNRTSTDEMERLIRDAGFTPARRKQDYTLLDPTPAVRPVALGARIGSMSGAGEPIGADAA
jgi:cyclic dehypoxanthinyl futalosine synthase